MRSDSTSSRRRRVIVLYSGVSEILSGKQSYGKLNHLALDVTSDKLN